MFCTNCGAGNRDEAVYCQKCGRMLETEEETRVARKPQTTPENDEEQRIFTISPTLVFVKIGYALAVFGALLLVAFLSIIYDYVKIPVTVQIVFGLSLLVIPAFYHFRQKLISYTLTDSKIEIDSGVISRTTRNVPLRTIQDVTVSASVSQRMLGFGDLIIENAGENAGKIILKNINSPKKYAEILLKQMRRLDR